MRKEEDSPGICLVDRDATFYNLIPSRFPTVDVFARIAPHRSAEIAEVESLTNPRLKERQRLLNGAAVVDVDHPLIQNWNHAPFTYSNPDGTRFFGPDHPALELAEDLQTALAISIRKREAFLSRTREEPTAIEMRVLKRRVKGRFADTTDTRANDREQCRRIGALVAESGLDGLLFHPAERPTGMCASILRGETLERAVQSDHFKFVWDGERISTIYSFSSGEAYRPEDLEGPDSILAA
jgi:hypothetical protein